MEKFNQLFKESTYSVKTINGGYHYYFKYCQDLKQTQGRGKIIDIRNDNGFVCAPPTKFNDQKYRVENDSEIREISQEQLDFLQTYLYPRRIELPTHEIPTDSKSVIELCLDCLADHWLETTQEWKKVAQCIRLHLKESGLPILMEWSRKSKHFQSEQWVIDEYQSIKDRKEIKDPEEAIEKKQFFNLAWLKRKAKFDNPNLYYSTVDNTEFSIDRMKDLADSSSDPIATANMYFNQYHWKIMDGGTIKYARVTGDETTIYNRVNFDAMYENARISYETSDGKKKDESISKLWCKYPKMNVCKGVSFEPNFRKVRLITKDNKINVWRGGLHKYDPNHKPNMKMIQPWLDHINFVWCDGQKNLYDFTLGRLATILQKPTHRCPIAMVILGQPGCGKSSVFDFIGMNVIGTKFYNYYNTVSEFLEGFNSEQEQALLCFLDEVNSGGAAWKKSDQLKGILTRKFKTINHKYGAQYTVPDFSSVFFATNNQSGIVKVDIGDRRYFMTECNNSRVGDVEYFNRLAALDTAEVGYEFFHYLLNYDLSTFNEQVIPETEWRTESMMYNISPTVYVLIEQLHKVWTDSPEDTELKMTTDVLWFQFCNKFGEKKHNTTKYSFLKQIKKFLGVDSTVAKINGDSKRCYRIGTDDLYKKICKILKISSLDDLLENWNDFKDKAGEHAQI
jgi:hypothetical protein